MPKNHIIESTGEREPPQWARRPRSWTRRREGIGAAGRAPIWGGGARRAGGRDGASHARGRVPRQKLTGRPGSHTLPQAASQPTETDYAAKPTTLMREGGRELAWRRPGRPALLRSCTVPDMAWQASAVFFRATQPPLPTSTLRTSAPLVFWRVRRSSSASGLALTLAPLLFLMPKRTIGGPC